MILHLLPVQQFMQLQTQTRLLLPLPLLLFQTIPTLTMPMVTMIFLQVIIIVYQDRLTILADET